MTASVSPKALSPILVLAATGAGVFVAALDQTVVVTALPDIFIDIGLPVTRLDQGAWIVTGYLLGYTAVMPLMGRVSDSYGHSRIYLLSMLIFMLGSALVALGENLGWIVGARIFQAIGGGALVPVTIAIVAESFPASRRGIAIGAIAAIAEAGVVLGPLYGGLVLRFLDWRWIFWVNLPLGAAVMALVLARVRSGRRPGVAVDYLGGLLLAGSLAALALGLSGEAVLPSGPGWRTGLLAGAALLFFLFIGWQSRARHPMLPLSIFRRLPLSAANGANLLVGGALILALVNIPLMTDTVMGRPPLEGGLRLLRFTAMIPVGALLGGALYQWLGYRPPMVLGLALAALGFGLLARWPLDIGDPRMTLELMVGGLGFGIVIAPITVAVLNHVRDDQKATASALVTSMRMVGTIAGLSALTSWGKDRFTTLVGRLPVPLTTEDSVYQSLVADAALTFFHELFFVGMIVCLVALVPALLMGGGGPRGEVKQPRPPRLTGRG